jgi:hypothetical protein
MLFCFCDSAKDCRTFSNITLLAAYPLAAATKEAAAAKRAAARAAKRLRKRAAQAVMAAAYAAIAAVQEVAATPGATANSSWAVVADLCGTCGLPPRRCMCI